MVVCWKFECGGDYNVCMVELEEGVWMMSWVDGIVFDGVKIDMVVIVFVVDVDGIFVVFFKFVEV